MTPLARLAAVAAVLSLSSIASATPPADSETPAVPPPSNGDLFPMAGHATAAAATGMPLLGIAEIGYAFTDWFALGAIGGIALAYVPGQPTPSVPTAGIRPRLRIATSQSTSLVLIAPALYYPSARTGTTGDDSAWLVARPELFFDGAVGERWHVAGGTGFIAAVSTEALGQVAAGHTVVMPPYNTTASSSTPATKGFAGGIWNTLSTRGSYRLSEQTHLFAEGTVVLMGVALAQVGGPPVVVTVGAQHTF
jgi:hypothetical protein